MNNKKIIKLLPITTLLIFMVGCSSEEPKIEKDNETEISVNDTNNSNESLDKINPNFGPFLKFKVTNGSNTENIGERGTVRYYGSELSKEDFVKFYEMYVRDSGLNWVTIELNEDKGIVFPGSLSFFNYGNIDEEGRIIVEEYTDDMEKLQ